MFIIAYTKYISHPFDIRPDLGKAASTCKDFHHCSGACGEHIKIFPLYKVNTVCINFIQREYFDITEGDFIRRRKETLLINILKPMINDFKHFR